MSHLVAAVLAGGASSRMGVDKARLPTARGASMLDHAVQAARDAGLEVVVVGRTHGDHVTSIQDDQPGLGPLGGLATVLRRWKEDVLLLGCDQPRITGEAIRWLVEESVMEPALGVATQVCGRWHPLFSVYRRSCLPLVEKHLAANRLALRELIASDLFRSVDVPERFVGCLINVNTPDEYQHIHSTSGDHH